MLSTMQDVPLTVTRLLEHGVLVHGRSQITTWTGEAEPQRRSFAEAGRRAVQLANALRDDLGIQDSDLNGRKSLGLLGMQERAFLFGGQVSISGTPGQGTRVSVSIPIHKAGALS